MRCVSFWSLELVKKLSAAQIAEIGKNLGENVRICQTKDGNIDPSNRETLNSNLLWQKGQFEELGLESPYDQIGRLENKMLLQEVSYSDIAQYLGELHNRFYDELNRQLCFLVPREQAKLFSTPQIFGAEVAERFQSAATDIEEAAKCLALQRGTASVFHLMRVMEVGLKAVAAALGIPYAPSWESYLRQIQSEIDKPWKRKSKKWKEAERFFRDVLANLHAVKVAWRNPTMHIVNHYTPETAREVFDAVKGFMRHLATTLTEEQPKKRGRKPATASAP